jgi:hypothetical protein
LESKESLSHPHTPADFSPSSPARRRAVRLLFAAWIFYFIAGLIIRKTWGEPYPGLFMPSFAGTGLSHLSATQGETVVPRITVTFSDRTTAEITSKQLVGGAFFPPAILGKYFVPKHRYGPLGGLDDRVRPPPDDNSQAMPTPPWPGNPQADPPVPADAERYLEKRVQMLFPDKTPVSVRIQLNREIISLDHPQNRSITETIAWRVIFFHDYPF